MSLLGVSTQGGYCGGVLFFQAEDGIRDGHVTGVQTCALPISGWGVLKRLGSLQKGMPTIILRTKYPMVTLRPARSGRQTCSREVYNPHLSWSLSIRGADAGAVRFDRRAATDLAGVR